MTKWETVFNNVLGSLVAGSREDLMDRYMIGKFDNHANCLTSIASIIADSAVTKMRYNEFNATPKGDSNEPV